MGRHIKVRSKINEKDTVGERSGKESKGAMLASHKVDPRAKNMTGNKEGGFGVIRGPVHQGT